MKNVLISFAFMLLIAAQIMGNANPPADNSSYKALFIGISNYSSSDWSNLQYAATDAEALKDLMEAKYGFSGSKILTNSQATKSNISKSISELVNNASEDDYIMIFFSGHGIEVENEGYWVPHDASSSNTSALISNTQVKDLIKKSRSKHILILSDGCFSGSAFKSPSFFVNNDGTPSYYKKIDMLISRQAMTSGGLIPVYDDAQNSVFVKYILKYLQNNDTKVLDAGELYELIQYAIYSNSPYMPRFGHIQNTGHEGGQFIFRISEPIEQDNTNNQPKADLADNSENTNNPDETKTQPVEEEKCNLTVSIKEGKAITFKGLNKGTITASSNDDAASYQWFFKDKTLNQTSNQLSVTESGNYQVIAYKSATCQSTTSIQVTFEKEEVKDLSNIEVFIQEGNKIEVTAQGILTAKTFTKENVKYEWKLGGVTIGTTPQIKVFKTGNYEIHLMHNGKSIASDYSSVTVHPRKYKTIEGDNLEKVALYFYKDKKYESLIMNANPGLIEKTGAISVNTTLIIPAKEQYEQSAVTLGVLKLVGANNFPPFCGPNAYKNGMITDVVKNVFDKMGQEYTVDYIPTNGHVGGLRFNKFVAAFPAQIQPNNRNYFLFSKPIYSVNHVLFSQAGEPFDWSVEKNIKNKVIAMVNGYNIDEINALADRKYVKIQPCKTLAQAFLLLKNGEVDLVASSTLHAYDTFATSDNLKQSDFYMVLKPINKAELYLAVSKQNPFAQEIIYRFNSTLDELEKNGTLTKIIDEHIDEFQKRP